MLPFLQPHPTNLEVKLEYHRDFCWILLGFEAEGVAEQKLGGGAHQGQSSWNKTTGARDL
ncbi:hypothetical protein BY996DRAFT_6437486 [Phakopsora pachyrhizi]|nr:hypothetical protein BY996DRAFT_6437486 [Phakopsora pachyrhizi]